MKLYIIFDYDAIVAAFSSQELAQKYLYINRLEYGSISTCELDDESLLEVPGGHELGPLYEQRLALTTDRIGIKGYLEKTYRHPIECEINIYKPMNDRDMGCLIVKSPVSEEHALEVALEKRKEWQNVRCNLDK